MKLYYARSTSVDNYTFWYQKPLSRIVKAGGGKIKTWWEVPGKIPIAIVAAEDFDRIFSSLVLSEGERGELEVSSGR